VIFASVPFFLTIIDSCEMVFTMTGAICVPPCEIPETQVAGDGPESALAIAVAVKRWLI
jgi:hypothetical protein